MTWWAPAASVQCIGSMLILDLNCTSDWQCLSFHHVMLNSVGGWMVHPMCFIHHGLKLTGSLLIPFNTGFVSGFCCFEVLGSYRCDTVWWVNQVLGLLCLTAKTHIFISSNHRRISIPCILLLPYLYGQTTLPSLHLTIMYWEFKWVLLIREFGRFLLNRRYAVSPGCWISKHLNFSTRSSILFKLSVIQTIELILLVLVCESCMVGLSRLYGYTALRHLRSIVKSLGILVMTNWVVCFMVSRVAAFGGHAWL